MMIPKRVKLYGRQLGRLRAAPRLRREIAKGLDADFAALARLWDNGAWSADAGYLRVVAEHAAQADGPILECGSGLTTVVAAAVSPHPVWSLEHEPLWRRNVLALTRRVGVTANVCLAPLTDYGSYHWYRVPEGLPPRFALAICDGPPESTPGGRTGLVRTLGGALPPRATILLDDAERPGEQAAIAEWSAPGWERVNPADAPYAVLRRSSPPDPSSDRPSAQD